MNLLTRCLTLALFLLLAGFSAASENQTEKNAKQKWYKVEVIIFTQRDVFGDELGSRNIVMDYPHYLIDLDNNAAGFIALPNNQRELGPDAYSLNRTGVYNVLFHRAWQQPGLTPDKAPWININVAGKDTSLNGSLRVYLSSYLHMESNIWQVSYATDMESTALQPLDNAALTEKGSSQTSPNIDSLLPTAAPMPWPQPPTSPIALLATPEDQSTNNPLPPPALGTKQVNSEQKHIEEIILLKQASRLKLNKLHYFDHPKMGILFKVSRSQAPIVKSLSSTEPPATNSTKPIVLDAPSPGANPALY
jgi:hypothetical protein